MAAARMSDERRGSPDFGVARMRSVARHDRLARSRGKRVGASDVCARVSGLAKARQHLNDIDICEHHAGVASHRAPPEPSTAPQAMAGPAAEGLESEVYPVLNFGQFLKAGNDESGVMSST